MLSSAGVYLPRLDHLRLLAALLVFVWHFIHFGGEAAWVPFEHVPAFPVLSLLEEGHTGVSLFLVLSGFIFMRLAGDRALDVASFYFNRLLRVMPLFAVWCLYYVQSRELDPVEVLVSSVFLLNRGAVPGVGWTVVVELQFYLIFPFLLMFCRRQGLRYLVHLLMLALCFRVLLWLQADTVQHMAYWTLFGRIDQFLLGMLAARLATHARLGGPMVSVGLFLAGLMVVVVAMHGLNLLGGFYGGAAGYPSHSAYWIVLPTLEGLGYALLVLGYLGLPVVLPPRIDGALAAMGAASYSIYWSHMLVIEVAWGLLARTGVEGGGFAAALAWGGLVVFPVCVLLSMASYALIERPFLALRKPYLCKLPAPGGNRPEPTLKLTP